MSAGLSPSERARLSPLMLTLSPLAPAIVAMAILLRPPAIFFCFDVAVAAIVFIAHSLQLCALSVNMPLVWRVSRVLLEDSFWRRKWCFLIRIFGGLLVANVGFAIWRLNDNDPQDLTGLLPTLLTAPSAMGAFAGGGFLMLFGIKDLAFEVSARFSRRVFDFLSTDDGEWSFYISGMVLWGILVVSSLIGSFILGSIFFLICAGLGVAFGWLSDATSSNPTNNYVEKACLMPSNEYYALSLQVPGRFDEARILADLERMTNNPSLIGQYLSTLRSMFTTRRQIELIDQWTDQYKARERLTAAQAGVLRASSDYRGIEREGLAKDAETDAMIAKHLADREEHAVRAAKARAAREIELGTIQERVSAAKRLHVGEEHGSHKKKRTQERNESEKRIGRLKAEKQKALQLEDDQERILKLNAIEDALLRELDHWSKLL